MKLIFLPADKYKAFLQDDTIALGMHSLVYRKYQNIKFALSLQYLKEKIKDEGDFSDKRQIFLQLNTIILVVCDQACLDYSK